MKPLSLWQKRSVTLCAALLLTLLILALAFRSEKLPSLLRADAPPKGGESVEVGKDRIEKSLLLDGELRAVGSRIIYATTSEEAKITYLPTEGSLVKAGDRLVELDSSTILDRIRDTEERIIAAENEIIKTRAQHESALRSMYVDLSKLWLAFEQAKVRATAPAELISRREHQENLLALEKSKSDYENMLTKIEQKKKEQSAELEVRNIERNKLEIQLDQARGNLDGMNIKAPADGMVIYGDHWAERRKLQIGDVVWGGFPLVRLPDLREMEILAQVNEVDGPRLAPGQRARIKLDSYPDTEIGGAVKSIAETAVKANWMAKAKVFHVVISLDNTVTEIMKPGMSAQIAVILSETAPQLLVPRSGVEFADGEAKVFRLEGEDVRAVAVTILHSDPLHYAVADNGALREGDRILKRARQ
jgi:multidrug resistance efflux pump